MPLVGNASRWPSPDRQCPVCCILATDRDNRAKTKLVPAHTPSYIAHSVTNFGVHLTNFGGLRQARPKNRSQGLREG